MEGSRECHGKGQKGAVGRAEGAPLEGPRGHLLKGRRSMEELRGTAGRA